MALTRREAEERGSAGCATRRTMGLMCTQGHETAKKLIGLGNGLGLAGRMLEGETAKLLRMEDELRKRVVGQDDAVRAARAALDAKSRAPETAAAMDAKLTTGRFYMERILPETALRLARISTGADTMMSLPAEMF